MKNYMLIASAISLIGTGTLFGDYFQQESGYQPSTGFEAGNNTWGYEQPNSYAPSYGEQRNFYDNSGRYGEFQQPQLYNQPSSGMEHYNTPGSGAQTYSPRGMTTGTISNPSNYTTDMHGGTMNPATQPRTGTMQPRNANGVAPAANQGVVKSNDNDKFTTDDDRRLGFQIRQHIAEKHPNLNLNALALYVDDGSVRITGRVLNEQEKTALSNLIKELKGVKSVNNKLEVGNGANGTTAPNSPLAVNETNQKYPSYVNPQQKNTYPNSTSNWTNSPAPTTNISGQDSMLADKIRQSIASDNSLSPQAKSVGIMVNSKTITLNGTVKSESEKNRLTAKVKGMSEGRLVNNMLEVNTTRR